MEDVTSLMVKVLGPMRSLRFRGGTCDESDGDELRSNDKSQVQRWNL